MTASQFGRNLASQLSHPPDSLLPMPSTLSWLDFSEADRRKAAEVIRLFEERGTVDELGLGTVRDALAERLFPGITVLQTRARYFLFVPWMYQQMEQDEVPSAKAEAEGRGREIRLIDVLAGREKGATGVIGSVARKNLRVLPSFIYWQGLGRWGIRKFQGAQGLFHRSLDRRYEAIRNALRTDDGEPAEGAIPANWDDAIPLPPSEWPAKVSLALEPREAAYLRHQIQTHVPGTYLAFLVEQEQVERADFPWAVPASQQAPANIRRTIEQARAFSEVAHGAAILYNLMLAEHEAGQADLEEKAARYRGYLEAWWNRIEARRQELAATPRTELWDVVERGNGDVRVSIGRRTREFVNGWFDRVLGAGSLGEVTAPGTRRTIREREGTVKGAYARLIHQRPRELWQAPDRVDPYVYRWPMVQTIVGDIHEGLRR